MKYALVLLWVILSGCAAQQQRAVNDAVAKQAEARTAQIVACASSKKVASCMLGIAAANGSGGANSIPVVQSDLAAFTGLVGAVAPVAGAIVQSAHNRDIALGSQAAQTAQAASQWGAIGGIVRDTTQAQSATATGAVNAFATFGSAALQANASATQANAQVATAYAQTLGLGFVALPQLVPSITAGGNVVQGDGNDFSTDTRRDTMTAGTELRIDSPGPFNTQYELVCTTGATGNGGSGTVPGAAGSAGAQNQTCSLVPIR